MIHWGAPRLLGLLFAVPVIGLMMMLGAWLKRRRLVRLADASLVPRLTDSRSPRWAAVKAACTLLGLTFVILAAARPQWGEKLQVYKGKGIDVVIALDASRSMLSTDVSPNRLSRAKTQIASLLDNLSTDRVAIVAFAGDAQVMCPLTTDIEAAKLFLDIIDPGNMPRPGTNIQHAVEAAASLFDPSDESSKALVLITDGDNLDGDPNLATRIAIENRIRLFAVGVGTVEGSTVPGPQTNGTSYMKGPDGKIVVSRLGERLLLVMAKETDGRYFRSESINLAALTEALDQIQKKAIGGGEFVEYEERYQIFLLVAFILLSAGILISDRRGTWFPRLAVPTWARRILPGATGILLVSVLHAEPARADVGSSMRHGLALEREKKYEEAIKAFQQALVLEPDNVRIHYDLGRALYENKQWVEAADHFQLGVLTKSKPLKARTLYNLGNAEFRQGKLDQAIASYSLALVERPDDLEAKQNLEYCLKLKAEQKPDSTQKQPKPQPQPSPSPSPSPQPQSTPAAQAQKGAMGKDEADRMLRALQNRELENLEKQPKKPQEQNTSGKDW